MGIQGEMMLIDVLNKETSAGNNYKMRQCIVRALALSNMTGGSIDFVIESLFKASM